jgi:hypothetical protein
MNKKYKLKKYLKATLIPLGINIILFFILFFIWPNDATRLADSFQVSGLLIFLFLALIVVHNLGAFDMIVFGTTRLFARVFPWSNVDMSKTYYDYVTEKKEERKKWPIIWPGMIIGLISVLIGFIFY